MHEAKFRITGQHFNLLCDLFGKPKIVGVEKRDVFAAARSNAVISGGRNTLILLKNRADARPVALQNFFRAVRRAVIDNDQLDISDGLREDAVNRLADVSRVIVVWDNYADLWVWHGRALAAQSCTSKLTFLEQTATSTGARSAVSGENL